jgi:glycogen operon protein
MRTDTGLQTALGATIREGGVAFAVRSHVAEQVEVCIFGDGERRFALTADRSGTHHGFVPGIGAGTRYGYRVHGPWDPEARAFCDPNKLLIDPWALGIDPPSGWPTGSCTGEEGDSAPNGLRSVVLPHPGRRKSRPRVPADEAVIYEAHVKGLTRRHPGVPDHLRGTFLGLASDAVLEHLTTLGVTAVELMPVAAFGSEPFVLRRGLQQYWGYNSISFFAPHAPYASDRTPESALPEFVEMVDRLHEHGLEVVLDVVVNHTVEGEEPGPHCGLRGLDDAAYYRIDADGRYDNITGTGNALDPTKPDALELILGSLRHWASLGVDGFRFDLASVLGRGDSGGFEPDGPFFETVANDPDLADLRLIAEPWDIGEGGYQLGNYPDRWTEWNDRLRDDARRFWRSEWHALDGFARRVSGSADIFGDRSPWASINFVTAHDGYTLRDLVSYERRHNWANGEDNRDGHSDNLSWNTGHEGDTGEPGIRRLRDRRTRSFLASLFLSRGTPMLLSGDELRRTQWGNNNAYAQDSELSWVDWSQRTIALTQFVRFLVDLRHRIPLAEPPAWYGSDGKPSHLRGGGHSFTTVHGAGDEAVLAIWNGGHEDLLVHTPKPAGVSRWHRLLDTTYEVSHPMEVKAGGVVRSHGFSVQVLGAQP